jgi:hypothetical protein
VWTFPDAEGAGRFTRSGSKLGGAGADGEGDRVGVIDGGPGDTLASVDPAR